MALGTKTTTYEAFWTAYLINTSLRHVRYTKIVATSIFDMEDIIFILSKYAFHELIPLTVLFYQTPFT
jgi:hypothetical protein